jgi:hypothetical protein
MALSEGQRREEGRQARRSRLYVVTFGLSAPDSYRLSVAEEVTALRATSR